MKRAVGRELLTTILRGATPQDLKVVGRTLAHAAIVGVAAGLMGAAFFAVLELVQRLVLEDLGGLPPPARARRDLPRRGDRHPALSPLAAGAAAGGGGAGQRHHLRAGPRDPRRRRRRDDRRLPPSRRRHPQARVWVKALASIFTLGTGGAGGREGPTMQIGGALGSLCARALRRLGRRAPDPAGRRRRGRHRGGVPHAAGGRAAGGRGALPRRLRVRRPDPGGARQRRRLLGRHLDLRRVDAVLVARSLPVRPQAPLALRAAGAAGLGAGVAVPLVAAHRAARDRVADDADLGAPGPGRAGARRLLRADHPGRRLAPGAAGPGDRPPGRRLRRGAAGHHRRQLAAGRVDGRRPCCSASAWPSSSPRRSPSARAAAPATSPPRW